MAPHIRDSENLTGAQPHPSEGALQPKRCGVKLGGAHREAFGGVIGGMNGTRKAAVNKEWTVAAAVSSGNPEADMNPCNQVQGMNVMIMRKGETEPEAI